MTASWMSYVTYQTFIPVVKKHHVYINLVQKSLTKCSGFCVSQNSKAHDANLSMKRDSFFCLTYLPPK